MATSEIFPFDSLPLELQALVVQNCDPKSLINFRHSCRHYSYLTDRFTKPQPGSHSLRIAVEYNAETKELDVYKYFFNVREKDVRKRFYEYIPTGQFWNNITNVRLSSRRIPDGDHANAFEKMKNFPLKIDSVTFDLVPIKFVSEILSIIGGVKETYFYAAWFVTNKFLMLDVLKYLPGSAYISDLYTGNVIRPIEHLDYGTNQDYLDANIIRPNEPTMGINHILKRLIDGSIKLKKLTIKSSNKYMFDILTDIEYITIYEMDNHENTIFGFIDLEHIHAKWYPVERVVAVKLDSGEIALVINSVDRFVDVLVCSKHELIPTLLERMVDAGYMSNFSEEFKKKLCDKKFF